MRPIYKIAENRTLDEFLIAISSGYEIFALEQVGNKHFKLVRGKRWNPERHELGAFRPTEPVKSLFFPPREYLGTMNQPYSDRTLPKRMILGVKNCDLVSLEIHDHVFLNTKPVDPFYAEARKKTVIVSCDCTDCLDVCFCPVVDEQPFPKKGFDINISFSSQVPIIEAGSKIGEELIEKGKHLLERANNEILQERNNKRTAMVKQVIDQAATKGLTPGMNLQQAIQKSFGSKLWDDFAEHCVECGACNFICCTCHCFLLSDGKNKDGMNARTKLWDSCLFMNFARVAGGGNPRSLRVARLRNRFEKKFNFFPKTLGCYACDGCGRCTEVCTAKIDIRDILRRAVDESESVYANTCKT